MLNFSHLDLKTPARRQLSPQLRTLWLGAVCLLVQQSPVGATNFDIGSSSQDFSQFNGQPAGPGLVPKDPTERNTNVKFSDFGTYNTPNLNPLPNPTNAPADLLPINQKNTTSDGIDIYSRSAQDAYRAGGSGSFQSGTYYSQAPQLNPTENGRNVNPFLVGGDSNTTRNSPLAPNSSLAPTSMALQAGLSQYGSTPLPGPDTRRGAPAANKIHFTYGFNKSPIPEFYNGSYNHFSPLNIPTGSGFLAPANLPPTSTGSCLEINQSVNPWTGK